MVISRVQGVEPFDFSGSGSVEVRYFLTHSVQLRFGFQKFQNSGYVSVRVWPKLLQNR